MRGADEKFLTNLPEPRSIAEVAAIALVVNRAAEKRYLATACEVRAIGSPEVAALLEGLADEHGACAERLEAEITAQHRPTVALEDPARFLPRGLTEDGTATCDLLGLTPYRVLAFAVRLAQQAFELYSYLSTTADKGICGYAERLADEELSHAARLRVDRRRAYRIEGMSSQFEPYPHVHLVESEADLIAAALALEERFMQCLAMVGEDETDDFLEGQSDHHRLAHLRRIAKRTGPPGVPMAAELAKFSSSAREISMPGGDREATKRYILAECDRAFAFYDAVTREAVNEAVLLQAQDLSQAAVERLRQIHALVTSPDETHWRDDTP